MQNIFSKILKNNLQTPGICNAVSKSAEQGNQPSHKAMAKRGKIVLFAVLFFVCIVGFFYANIKSATAVITVAECKQFCVDAGATGNDLTNCQKKCESGISVGGLTLVEGTGTTDQYACEGKISWWGQIVVFLIDIIPGIIKAVAVFASNLSASVIEKINSWSITNASSKDGAAIAFVAGWTTVRDLANMLIVLGFVIVGIATALRIQEYGAKKFLGKLIIIALLVNFSGLFCGIIIDASRITMSYFLGNNATMGESILHNARMSEKDIVCKNIFATNDYNNYGRYAVGRFMFIPIYLTMAFALLYLAIIFIARYAILGILFMLAPIAFVCWAFPFPDAKKIWNEWWEKFLKWAFVGVQLAFFFWLANMMLSRFSEVQGTYDEQSASKIFFYLIVVLMTIIVGIRIAIKGGGFAAKAAMAVAGGAGALALYAGGGIVNKTGLARLGAGIKDTATRAGERFGLVAPGTTDMNQAGRLNDKDRNARINSMSTEDMDRELQAPRRGQKARLDRAAMTLRKAKEGTLGTLGDAQRQRAINETVGAGGSAKELVKGMGSGDVAGLINNPAANPLFNSAETRAEGMKVLTERNDLNRIDVGARAAAVAEFTQHGGKVSDLAKSDHEFARHNANRVAELVAGGVANAGDVAVQEQLTANISNYSGSQRRHIIHGGTPTAAPAGRPADSLTPGLIVSRMNADTLKDFRTSAAPDRQRVFGAGGAMNPALETELTNSARRAADVGPTANPWTTAPGPNSNRNLLNKLQEMHDEIRNNLMVP